MAIVKPVLRIFDYQKAIELYVQWLDFTLDWEHQPEKFPVYLQVSWKDSTLHLSEHHGDGTPGTHVFIDNFEGLAADHQQILAKSYKYNRYGIETPFYDAEALETRIIDPFANILILEERNVRKQLT